MNKTGRLVRPAIVTNSSQVGQVGVTVGSYGGFINLENTAMIICDCAPSLHDLVNDPLTRMLMKRDGVEPADLVRLIASVKTALNERKRRDFASNGRCGVARRYYASHPGTGRRHS